MNAPQLRTSYDLPPHLYKVAPFQELRYEHLGSRMKAEIQKLTEHPRIEHGATVSLPTGEELSYAHGTSKGVMVPAPKGEKPPKTATLHTHPKEFPPSPSDVADFLKGKTTEKAIVITINGTIYELFKTPETLEIQHVAEVYDAWEELRKNLANKVEVRVWAKTEAKPWQPQELVLFELSKRFKFGIRKGRIQK